MLCFRAIFAAIFSVLSIALFIFLNKKKRVERKDLFYFIIFGLFYGFFFLESLIGVIVSMIIYLPFVYFTNSGDKDLLRRYLTMALPIITILILIFIYLNIGGFLDIKL